MVLATPAENEFSVILSPCVNRNSEWIKGFNLKSQALKLTRQDVGSAHEDIQLGKDFLNRAEKLSRHPGVVDGRP